ncbi:MAG: DNA replication and repair protein RecF, partial [Oscillospiraceae bacterium]|nr:DNA replication and repair protein RecF [Oscillospiraceae bacterium]
RFDAAQSFIKGDIFARERDHRVEVDLFTSRRRRMKVNGVAAKTAAELSGVLNTVFFSPEDLHLIREGAAARRRFMDAALCQLRPRYAAAHAEYARAYEHKTRILRDSEEHPSLLEALPEFNEQMIRAGAVIVHYRAQFCARLAEYAAAAHFDCSGGRERLELSYQTVKTVKDPLAEVSAVESALREHQSSHEAAERTSRLCLSGPHKDDICVFINEKEAKAFSSQGQTRTAALSMKLAEREIFKNVTGEYPVLLLDDVLSELDPRRQEFVLNRIGGGQVFITCCEDDRLAALTGGRVFTVANGEVF